MHTTLFLLLVPVGVAAIVALVCGGRAAGWFFLCSGIIFLGHAGFTMYRIHANDGVTDSGNFYGLFATVPVGALLLLIGAGVFWFRACAARCAAKRLEEKR